MWVAVEDVCVGAGRVVAGVCWVNANVVVRREDGRGRWQASDDAWVDMNVYGVQTPFRRGSVAK